MDTEINYRWNSTKTMILIMGILFSIAAIVITLITSFSVGKEINIRYNYPTATGYIGEIAEKERWDDYTHPNRTYTDAYTVYYTFTADDMLWYGKFKTSSDEYLTASTVDIKYNPDNPSKNYGPVNTTSLLLLIGVTLLFDTLSLGLWVFLYFLIKKPEKFHYDDHGGVSWSIRRRFKV